MRKKFVEAVKESKNTRADLDNDTIKPGQTGMLMCFYTLQLIIVVSNNYYTCLTLFT